MRYIKCDGCGEELKAFNLSEDGIRLQVMGKVVIDRELDFCQTCMTRFLDAVNPAKWTDVLNGSVERIDVDLNHNLVTYRDHRMHLQPTEAVIMQTLVKAMPNFVADDDLHTAIYGLINEWPDTATSALRVHICKLRRRLEVSNLNLRINRSGWGAKGGYSIEVGRWSKRMTAPPKENLERARATRALKRDQDKDGENSAKH